MRMYSLVCAYHSLFLFLLWLCVVCAAMSRAAHVLHTNDVIQNGNSEMSKRSPCGRIVYTSRVYTASFHRFAALMNDYQLSMLFEVFYFYFCSPICFRIQIKSHDDLQLSSTLIGLQLRFWFWFNFMFCTAHTELMTLWDKILLGSECVDYTYTCWLINTVVNMFYNNQINILPWAYSVYVDSSNYH